jgi:hypothetical protein
MKTPNMLRSLVLAAVAAFMVTPVSGTPTRAAQAAQTSRPPLKVFISVDMEGLAGVATSTDVNTTGRDYEHFRIIMAAETNAAIEGAIQAGATDVVVRDSHGGKQNLLPGDLLPPARLIRGSRFPAYVGKQFFHLTLLIGRHAMQCMATSCGLVPLRRFLHS